MTESNKRGGYSLFASLFRKSQLKSYWALFLLLSAVLWLMLAVLVWAFAANEGNAIGIISPANDTWNRTASVLGINFTCNATDIRGTFVNLSLVGNFSGAGFGVYRTNTTVVQQNITFGFNITLSDGQYNWSCIIANESASINDTINNSNVRIIKVDNTAPVVAINKPLNKTFNSSGSFNISFTVTENNLETCSLFTNESGSWALDHSALASEFTSGHGYNMTFTASDGSYMVNVTCNDSARGINVNASDYLITIDTAAPIINFINMTGGSATGNWTSNGNITFHVNVTDRTADKCVVYTNLTLGAGAMTNRSNVTFSYTANTTSNSAAQDFADGSYLFNVTCNDSAASQDSSYGATVNFNIDTVYPIVAINKPLNNTFNNSGTINISFTVTEANLDTCSLFTNESGNMALDHTANASEFTSGHGYNMTFTASDGSYMVNVTCNDSAGRRNVNSSNYLIKIDTTAPGILNITPNSSNYITAFNSSNIFRFTISEATLNESGTRYGNFSFVWRKSSPSVTAWQNETGGSLNTRECDFSSVANQFNCSANINLGALDSGEGTVVQYYITTFDSAGNYNSNGTAETPNQITLDKSAPLINSINVTGYWQGSGFGNWSNSNTITFYANVTENNTDTCIVYTNVSGSILANTLETNYTNVSFSYTSNALSASAVQQFADGSYRFNITCNDSSARQDFSYGTRIIFNVDGTAPIVGFISPLNNTFNQSGTVTFTFVVTENNLDNCTLFTNATGSWARNYSASAAALAADGYNFSLLGMHDSNYLVNISCADLAGNRDANASFWTVMIDTVNPVVNFFNTTGYRTGTNTFNNQNWSSTNTLTFYVNVTDDNYWIPNGTCSIYTNMSGSWAINYTGGGPNATLNYTSDQLSASSSAPVLHDGSFQFNVSCNDSSGRRGQYGSAITVNIDTVTPIVAVKSPQNLSYNSSSTVKVGFYYSEANVANCSLWTNATGSWALNASINSTNLNNTQNNNTFTLAGMHDATYKVNVSCTDAAGTDGNNASDYIITVDTTTPVFSEPKPSNNSGVQSGTSILFAVNVTERNLNTTANHPTNFPIGGAVRAFFKEESASSFIQVNLTCISSATSGVFYCSNTTVNAGLADGNILLYYFYVNDSAGLTTNNGTADNPLRATIDETTPVINSINATGYSSNNLNFSSSSSVTFYVNVTDNSADSCVIYTNASPATGNNLTANVTLAYTSNALSASSAQIFSDGSWRFNATCNDTSARVDGSYGTTIVFNVDTVAPVVALKSPNNNSFNSSGIRLNLTFTVTENNLDSCDLYTNVTGVFIKNASALGTGLANAGYNFTLSDMHDGSYLWNVKCNDSAGNNALNTSNFTVHVDATVPVINFLNTTGYNKYSAGANWSNSNSITFYVNVTDNNPFNATCTIYTNVSGSILANTLETNYTNVSFSYTSNALSASAVQQFADGSYRLNVSCNDSANNRDYSFSGNSTIFNVDATSPVVAINSPSNNSYNNSGIRLNFTFAVTENNLDYCSFYTNATGSFVANVTVLGTDLANGGYNFTLSDMHDGSYLWNVRCNDSAGNNALNTSNLTVTVDATVPVINSFNSTGWNKGYAGDNWSNSGNITFYVNVTENNYVFNATCTVYTNSSGGLETNMSNTTFSYTSNALSTSSAQVFADGSYRLNVSCNDSANNRDYSFSANSTLLNVDTVDPTNSITSPLNNTFNASSTFSIYFKTTENNLDTCTLWSNMTGSWAVNATLLATAINTSNSNNTFVIAGMHDTSYLFNITCNDSAARYAKNATFFTLSVDATVPVINYLNHTFKHTTSTGNFSDNGNITFYVNVTDLNPAQCVIYTNASPAIGNNLSANVTVSYTNGALTATSSQVFADGSYRWNATCNDTARNVDATYGVVLFSVDTVDPIVAINKPANDSLNTTTTSINITFTVTEANLDSCSLFTNESGSWALDHSAVASVFTSDGYNMTFTAGDGSYMVNVTCNDSSGRYARNASNFVVSIDATAPTINFINATGYTKGNWSNTRTITFYINATNNNPDKCVVYTNLTGSWAANDSTLFSWTSDALNATASITVATNVSSMLWNVSCNDTSSNKGQYTPGMVLNIDTATPAVRLVNPANASFNTTSTVTFEYSASDNATLDTCELFTDLGGGFWRANFSNTSVSVDVSDISTITLADGAYKWNVRCNDSAGNSAFNATNYTLTVNTLPDINYSQALTKNWNTLNIPTTTIMGGTPGMTFANTQGWNISYVLSTRGKLDNNYDLVYYNTDGTNSGWKSFAREDWAGSSLQYVNNTNDKVYWINMSAADTFQI